MMDGLSNMYKAYTIMGQALKLLGWERFYNQLNLSSNNINELCYYSDIANDRDFALCQIVRGILWDSIPALYQILK